jgi:hypothetical protein
MTAEAIVERIKKATPFSPIAVFRLTKEERTLVEAEEISSGVKRLPRGGLNAIFANSVTAKKRAKEDSLYVGVYDRRDSASLVMNQLKRIERRR